MKTFSDKKMVKDLQSSASRLADVTFMKSRKLFFFLYISHNQGPGIAPACVYGFLPSKTQSTYRRFLEIFMSLFPNAAPDKVVMNFELAAMKAFEKALPKTTISGCFFLLSENFTRPKCELGFKKHCTNRTQSCR